MKYTVKLSRSEETTVVVDTEAWPVETAHWPALSPQDLHTEVIAAAWEIVTMNDWDEVDDWAEVAR